MLSHLLKTLRSVVLKRCERAVFYGRKAFVKQTPARNFEYDYIQLQAHLRRLAMGDFDPDLGVQPGALMEAAVRDDLRHIANRLSWGRQELEDLVESVTQELRSRKEEAEKATFAKSQFLTAASHDLRQPVHAIGLFLAQLTPMALDAAAHQVLENLDTAVQSMQDMLDGLLDISRLEAGSIQPNFVAHPLNATLQTTRAALSPLAHAKGLRLRIRPSQLWALTDPVLLQRIVLNLGHNAIRYTEQGAVMIVCRQILNGTAVRVDVLDSGVGIAPEHQSQIFDEFYQVGAAEIPIFQGLGLGLHIVDRTAHLLGATLALHSAPHKGSRFSVTLPLAQARASYVPRVMNQEASPLMPSGEDGAHIVIIEADALVLSMMQRLLQTWGCHVQSFQDTAQAIDVLQKSPHPIDAMLINFVDLGASLESRLGALESLRRVPAQAVPICLVSDSAESEFLIMADDLGLPVVQKPIRPAKLRALLRRMLPTH